MPGRSLSIDRNFPWTILVSSFSRKGDAAIHNEISVFVYRYDLKQSQIARMAGSFSPYKNFPPFNSPIRFQRLIKRMSRNSCVVICSISPKMVEWPSVDGIFATRK